LEGVHGETDEWDHKLSAEVKEGPADCIRMAEVRAALKEIKRHKAPGLSGLVTEMIQATGEIGAQWILDLCNGIVKEGSIPEDWKSSVVLPIYKGKGNPMECGSCRPQGGDWQRQRRPYGKWILQATGEIGAQWILDLCNGIVKEGSIPEDWKSSVVLPIYKGGIKLLEHAMKVVERIFEHRIRQRIVIGDMRFGFMRGRGTPDAIFVAREF